MRILGLDPGLQHTGWGLIEAQGNRLRHVANGTIRPPVKGELAARLAVLYDCLDELIQRHAPHTAAVEETFVNQNPTSTLKLGMARGVILLVPSQRGISVGEYAPNKVKKSVVGVGKAGKEQVQLMVKQLLPGVEFDSPDAADALAVAICHAHYVMAQTTIHSGRRTA